MLITTIKTFFSCHINIWNCSMAYICVINCMSVHNFDRCVCSFQCKWTRLYISTILYLGTNPSWFVLRFFPYINPSSVSCLKVVPVYTITSPFWNIDRSYNGKFWKYSRWLYDKIVIWVIIKMEDMWEYICKQNGVNEQIRNNLIKSQLVNVSTHTP